MNAMTDATWPEYEDDVCPDCGEDPCICLDDKPGEKSIFDEDDEFIQNLMDRDNE